MLFAYYYRTIASKAKVNCCSLLKQTLLYVMFDYMIVSLIGEFIDAIYKFDEKYKTV